MTPIATLLFICCFAYHARREWRSGYCVTISSAIAIGLIYGFASFVGILFCAAMVGAACVGMMS